MLRAHALRHARLSGTSVITDGGQPIVQALVKPGYSSGHPLMSFLPEMPDAIAGPQKPEGLTRGGRTMPSHLLHWHCRANSGCAQGGWHRRCLHGSCCTWQSRVQNRVQSHCRLQLVLCSWQ